MVMGGKRKTDKSAKCPEWARAGECDRNPGYMLAQCAASCAELENCSSSSGKSTTKKKSSSSRSSSSPSVPSAFASVWQWVKYDSSSGAITGSYSGAVLGLRAERIFKCSTTIPVSADSAWQYPKLTQNAVAKGLSFFIGDLQNTREPLWALVYRPYSGGVTATFKTSIDTGKRSPCGPVAISFASSFDSGFWIDGRAESSCAKIPEKSPESASAQTSFSASTTVGSDGNKHKLSLALLFKGHHKPRLTLTAAPRLPLSGLTTSATYQFQTHKSAAKATAKMAYKLTMPTRRRPPQPYNDADRTTPADAEVDQDKGQQAEQAFEHRSSKEQALSALIMGLPYTRVPRLAHAIITRDSSVAAALVLASSAGGAGATSPRVQARLLPPMSEWLHICGFYAHSWLGLGSATLSQSIEWSAGTKPTKGKSEQPTSTIGPGTAGTGITAAAAAAAGQSVLKLGPTQLACSVQPPQFTGLGPCKVTLEVPWLETAAGSAFGFTRRAWLLKLEKEWTV